MAGRREMNSCTSVQNARTGSCEYVNEPSDSRSREILDRAGYSRLSRILLLEIHYCLTSSTAIPSPYRRWCTTDRPVWIALELQVRGQQFAHPILTVYIFWEISVIRGRTNALRQRMRLWLSLVADNWWNSPNCYTRGMNVSIVHNYTNHTSTPVEEYWE